MSLRLGIIFFQDQSGIRNQESGGVASTLWTVGIPCEGSYINMDGWMDFHFFHYKAAAAAAADLLIYTKGIEGSDILSL